MGALRHDVLRVLRSHFAMSERSERLLHTWVRATGEVLQQCNCETLMPMPVVRTAVIRIAVHPRPNLTF